MTSVMSVSAPRATRCLAASRRMASPAQACQRRPYQSYDHPTPEGPFGAVEEAILCAAYKQVPKHGFSQRALGIGARDAGYLDISPSVLSDSIFSLIRYHLITQRQNLATKTHELFNDQEKLSPGSKVAMLTWQRMLGNKAVINQWQEALAVMAQPSYVSASLKELALLSDEIWYLSGDTSVDSSWYTKRATLSMIYTSTELFMTNDTSPDFADTKQFLSRRFDELKSVGGAARSVGRWVGFTLNAGVNVLRSKGTRI